MMAAPAMQNNYLSDQNQMGERPQQNITGNIRGYSMYDANGQQQPNITGIRVPPSNAPTGMQNMGKGGSFHV